MYFHGCGANYYEPRLGEMTVAVLAHNGLAVDVPKQDCCGLPLQSNELFDDARRYVRRLVGRLGPAAGDDGAVIGTSTSCTLMLKREAKDILGMEGDPQLEHREARGRLRHRRVPPRAARARRTARRLPAGRPDRHLPRASRATASASRRSTCCARARPAGGRERRELLRRRRDYGRLKKEKYAISMKVGSTLFGQIERAAPDLAVCDSETCRWHIEKATGVRSVHPVEILHRAYGLR